ncbi:solute-binding protein [Acidithiobacillus sp. VAN18-1]|uniref:Solute-binding protein n=2 Tax=Igneacidithiobacillus copahuensis TaxID=2724909 RepID=A0AAE2YP97_9PROT|nr:solute-binding protein [Igneacidithiobacillus copahuensis]MBU2795983.1 solute-binding protein [Acidithiobacillus sp. VAN18-2]
MLKITTFLTVSAATIMYVSLQTALGSTVYVYGPGGPFPAMNAAAKTFNKQYGENVTVEAGPLNKWKTEAQNNADIIYSGSENMMTDFVSKMPDLIDEKTIYPAYIRPAAILVHPGNPLHINRFSDLLKPGISVMVVQGAGQTGLWEDIAGKNGNLQTIRKLRKNIVYYAPNSADALHYWESNKSPDAWIIYNIWQISHPGSADIVPIGKRHIIYRDMDLSFTYKGEKNSAAMKFYHFLLGKDGKEIFKKYGWHG